MLTTLHLFNRIRAQRKLARTVLAASLLAGFTLAAGRRHPTPAP